MLLVALAPLLIGIGCSPNNPNQGFTIRAQEDVTPVGGLPPGGKLTLFPLPNLNVFGDYSGPAGGQTSGTANYYNEATDQDGQVWISNAITPGYWNHRIFLPPFCANPIPPVYYVGSTFGLGNEFGEDNVLMQNKGIFGWLCVTDSTQTPEASSRFAYAGNVPSSVTLSALDPYSTTYGYPIMYVYNGANGAPNLYTTVTASSVAPDGSSATFPLPSSMPQNAYFFSTANATPSGGFLPNSYNFYSVAGQQTFTGNPFGVAVAGQTVRSTTTIMCPRRSSSSSSSYNPDPLVSLYSTNQVYIHGTYINVGPNPTAVAAFAGPIVTTTDNEDCIDMTATTSGMTLGLVANSGGNTVTMLDLVNRQALTNITVGNQPVALAVSSDASTAYVANYSDSTVTRIALNNGDATTTIAVGGQPTSLALTSGGTLWVGGNGFISEINTATMQLVATESMPNESVASLGYSDEENQIIATTVDGSGNVYSDQINPASIVQGGNYQPLASNLISGLGTHLNTRTQQYIQAYTATLASAPSLNAIQPGAPPLVVQDGWLVVTATPTGFSITDITGNVVLVSETTASPVTAIAVDPNLNVAYLAMPDSNTVLEVPLPGTGN